MRRVYLESGWPESWQESYRFDLEEVYDEVSNRGYAYCYQNRRDRCLRAISEIAQPGAKVLDVAAGQGNLTLALAEAGYAVTWNDIRDDLAGYVRLKWERGDVRYSPGNAFELNVTGEYDVVVINEVIEHVAHPDQFLRHASSLVRRGGYLVMTTPNGGYFRNPLPKFSDFKNPSVFESKQFRPDSDGHIFLLHVDEVYSLANAAGLSVVSIQLFNNPLTAGHLKLSFALRLLPRSWVDRIEAATAKLVPLRNKLNFNMLVVLARPE